ncbi:helix-turn-helix domain-containing protein [Pseudarthrobacter oxydans]|uniref:helix-turn-helix domain-containing protein n=1 Tax=Pseudarthrobacter oxydans TaxID=1671 RepID=UPI0015738D45|nr:helix-turn-helix domain-containing protein [Pseudarthrobacter oxydans]NSX37830.1 helix-turn-helix domain-containing protein [Pseudarthrobacter oxydans]
MKASTQTAWNDAKTSTGLPRMAFTISEVAEMLAEPEITIKKHCQTQALRGAYKTGGKTSPWRIPPKAIDYYQATRSNQ